MHVRFVTSKHNGRTFRYAQLVKSYRRPEDGMPAQRIIAHLGKLSDQEVENLKLSLAANRHGRRVVVAPKERPRKETPVILDNLTYLDIAVARAMWHEWNLDELLESLIPTHEKEASPARVTAALTIQRCVDPGSKLYAQRWFPRTALPELLGIAPGQFNNTRLHRILEQLDKITPELQRRLPPRYAARAGAFTALFLDVTDTWFVGHGPDELAQKGQTKEGLYRSKIGIVLMCNQDGLPLRWEVIPGCQHDSQSMLGLLESVHMLDWVRDAPVVCDRAMGKTAHLRKLLASGLRFLTALTEDEFDAYTESVPHQALTEVAIYDEHAASLAAAAVAKAGMTKVSDSLHVLDLEVIERRQWENSTEWAVGPQASTTSATPFWDPLERALDQASKLRTALEQGHALNLREAGRPLGLKKERATQLLRLLELAPDLREDISNGRATGVAINAGLRIARLADPQAQRIAFDGEVATAQKTAARKQPRPKRMLARLESESPVRLRAIVCFNPGQFIQQRRGADEVAAQLRAFTRNLNEQLKSPRSRRTRENAYACMEHELRRRTLVEAYDIVVTECLKESGKKNYLNVELKRRENVWQRLRRFDGFSIVVAHPDSKQDAASLARLYRAKDQVEKDFQDIKGVVELRPIRHRTGPKVRAHVTLCMLALLLDRTLEHKLATNPACNMTACRAFEELANVHLNRIATADLTAYTITRPSQDQVALLKTLGLEDLIQDDKIADKLTPR